MMDAKQDLARNIDAAEVLEKRIGVIKKKLETAKRASSLSTDQQHAYHSAVASLSAIKEQLVKDKPSNSSEAFKLIKKEYSKGNKELKAEADQCGKALSNVFHFVEEVFKDGQEMLILVTELTANYYTADYISHFGCKEYFEHNKDLLFYDRQKEIISQLDQLELK